MNRKRKPNLYLAGFMGTGKSTVGRLAAQRLGLEFMDSDHAIEAQQGRSIPDIFAQDGEPAFREMERAFVENGHPGEGCLIACGGGLVIQPGMMETLKGKGLVFSLIATAEGVFERTRHNSNRPLLQVEDPLAQIAKLMAARDPIYRQAHVQILTEGRHVNDVVAHVCRSYKLEAAQRKL
ncbi:shikimate kinase [Pelagicoccus sp. SDUM812003]|uniref:shikimate kinase n=1 Tax=Pelagicoccus sp. SDUM812003 TaxID=3041267 RepID=UPI00280FBBE7|nr:shikimate kinase [Pelagicoccus sp. SDUM812003]MDQ8205560.1 shikimate kinase [Pelagicoccus sp. SDUM812003]